MKQGNDARSEELSRQLEKYFMEYRTLVIRNAYLRVRDYHTAEDICQETFIRLSGYLDRVPPEKVKAWLICVSDHLALDVLRKYKSRDSALERMQDEAERKRGAEPDSILEQKENFQETGMALNELRKVRPNWYEVIRLSCLEDMDARTIGKILGVRPGLINKWKERGRRWLRDTYRKKKEDE